MADTSGLVTLDKTVREFMMLTGRDLSHYNRLYQIAANGLRDLHEYSLNEVRVVKRTPNDIGVIEYPSDLIEVVGVFRNIDGEYYPIQYGNDMIDTTTLVDGVETQDGDYGEGDMLDTGQEHNYGYGTRGGKGDYYWVNDRRNRRVMVNGTPSITYFIKYISSGLDTGADSIEYPVQAKEALLAWMRWQDYLYRDDINKSAIREYRNEWENAVVKLTALQLPDINAIRDMIYTTTTQAPRR